MVARRELQLAAARARRFAAEGPIAARGRRPERGRWRAIERAATAGGAWRRQAARRIAQVCVTGNFVKHSETRENETRSPRPHTCVRYVLASRLALGQRTPTACRLAKATQGEHARHSCGGTACQASLTLGALPARGMLATAEGGLRPWLLRNDQDSEFSDRLDSPRSTMSCSRLLRRPGISSGATLPFRARRGMKLFFATSCFGRRASTSTAAVECTPEARRRRLRSRQQQQQQPDAV